MDGGHTTIGGLSPPATAGKSLSPPSRPDGSRASSRDGHVHPTRAHLLTVVLEDYFQVAPLKKVVETAQWYRFETRVEANTLKALDLLDQHDIKATFFVVGWIADEMPEVVAAVAARGHEIASKGYYHRSIRQLGREEFRDDLVRSREALERASQTRVLGYRIAHGWFGREDLWALDVLAEEGFAYDSSIRPIFWSLAQQPWRRFIHRHEHAGGSLWELPLSSWSLGSWCLPIAGGNYLRQLPHVFMRRAVGRWVRSYDDPLMMYFHVWELDPDQPRIQAAPALERIRQYRNLDKMAGLVRYYLERYRFIAIRDFLRLGGEAAATPAKGSQRAEMAQPAARISSAPATENRERQTDVAPAPRRRRPLTVVVPCYNEELILPYLANTLRSVQQTLEGQYELSFVFVDDGSVDGTWAALRKTFGDRPDCRLVRHDENRGVAGAILTGVRHAGTDTVCSIDCDCTYDPHQLSSLIPMLRDGVDMVTASPYHRHGQVRNVPAWRLLLSKRLSSLYRLVLGHKLATYTSCFRVYRREAVLELPVREGGFLGVAEMLGLLHLRGGRIVECPAVLEVRLLGRSKMKLVSTVTGHLRLLARLALLRLKAPWRRAARKAGPFPAGAGSRKVRPTR